MSLTILFLRHFCQQTGPVQQLFQNSGAHRQGNYRLTGMLLSEGKEEESSAVAR